MRIAKKTEVLTALYVYTSATNPIAPEFSPASSRRHLDSYVAMIMVNLPFPPLPVVVRRGDEEAVASGHDLLSQMIACALVAPDPAATESVRRQERKAEILHQLHADLAALPAGAPPERAYGVFCRAFRAFAGLYPGSPDLRFWPLDKVDAASPLMAQGRAHLGALSTIVTEDNEIAPLTVHSQTYRDLLRSYAEAVCC